MIRRRSSLMTPGRSAPTLGPALEQQHMNARAKLMKLEEVSQKQRVIREQFDRLKDLGDVVTEDDVIDAASRVVGAGIPPMAVASLLSEMPTGGPQALADWISGQDEIFRTKELALAQAANTIRFEAGLAALRLLAHDHLAPQGISELAPGVEAPANPLAAQGAPALGPDVSPPLAPEGEMGGNALMSLGPNDEELPDAT